MDRVEIVNQPCFKWMKYRCSTTGFLNVYRTFREPQVSWLLQYI